MIFLYYKVTSVTLLDTADSRLINLDLWMLVLKPTHVSLLPKQQTSRYRNTWMCYAHTIENDYVRQSLSI